MSRPPSITGKQLIKVLKELGFQEVRVRGSHPYLRHPDGRTTVVPAHAGDHRPGASVEGSPGRRDQQGRTEREALTGGRSNQGMHPTAPNGAAAGDARAVMRYTTDRRARRGNGVVPDRPLSRKARRRVLGSARIH
jgi:predicted RNA binding protein YcfA (HicA-like mRNA interferase family)